MKLAVVVAIIAACAGTLWSAETKYDPLDKSVAFIKKKLGLDQVPATQATQSAHQPALRAWPGLKKDMAFVKDWSISSTSSGHIMPYGMFREYTLRKRSDQKKKDAGYVVIRVSVGVSADAAMEMALRRMATTSLPLEVVVRNLSVSCEGPGDKAVLVGCGDVGKITSVFIRDNIAVSFETYGVSGVEGIVNSIANGIDEEIKTSEKIAEKDLNTICPRAVIVDVKPHTKSDEKRFTVTLAAAKTADECEVVGILDDGAKGTYDPKKRIIYFRVRRASRARRYVIIVYDRRSLLCSMTTGEIPSMSSSASQPTAGPE